MSTRVDGGTRMPASSAMVVAARPTTFVFGVCVPGRKTKAPTAWASSDGKKVRALPATLFERRLPHRFFDDDGLLGRADRAVIKRLSGKNVADGFANIRRAFDERGHVARTDAVSGFARSVGGAHQASAARRQDHAHIAVAHQLARSGKRGVLHATDQAFRAPGGERSAAQHSLPSRKWRGPPTDAG